MAKLLISKFIDRAGSFERNIDAFSNAHMQLGFFDPSFFFSYNHRDLVRRCADHNIKIDSIHVPTVDIFEEKKFFDMLDMTRAAYGVDNVTIHPGSGSPFTAYKLFEKNEANLADLGISLLYENFDSSKRNKRWLPFAKTIYTVPIKGIFLTYDTSHVPVSRDIVQDLSDFLPRLGMVHLSNRSSTQNHLPVFQGNHNLGKVIDYLKTVSPFAVLEYHANDAQLLADYAQLKQRI